MAHFIFLRGQRLFWLGCLLAFLSTDPAAAQSWPWGNYAQPYSSYGDINAFNQSVRDSAGNVFSVGGFGGQTGKIGSLGVGLIPPTSAPLITFNEPAQPLVVSYTAAGTLRWSLLAGPYGNRWIYPGPTNYGEIFDAALTPQGDLVVVGVLNDTSILGNVVLVNTAGASKNGFVAKLSGATGQPQWAQIIPSPASSVGRSVVVDPTGNVYVAGDYTTSVTCGPTTLTNVSSSTVFIASLTPSGQWRWATSAGGPGPGLASELVRDGAGSLVLTGTFKQGVVFGSQPLTCAARLDAYLATLSPLGQWLAATNITNATGSVAVEGVRTAAGSHGALYVIGQFNNDSIALPGTITIGTTTLAASTVVVGNPNPRSYGRTSSFLAHRDSIGQWTWTKLVQGGVIRTAEVNGVACDERGNVYIGGVCRDTVLVDTTAYHLVTTTNRYIDPGVFALSLSPEGDYQWRLGSMTDPVGGFAIRMYSLGVGAPGEVYLQCSTQGAVYLILGISR